MRQWLLTFGWTRCRIESEGGAATESQPAPVCPECRYDLSGLGGAPITCPECGTLVVDTPALLSGRMTPVELDGLRRLVAWSAALNVAGAVLLSAGALFMAGGEFWAIFPLSMALPIELGFVLIIARIRGMLQRARVRLGRAAGCALALIMAKPPAALAVAMPLIFRAASHGAMEDGPGFLVWIIGAFATLVMISVQARFLEQLVRGVAAGTRRQQAHDLAEINLVLPLMTIGLMFCVIGLVLAPVVVVVGACMNAAMARMFWRAVTEHLRAGEANVPATHV